MPTTETKTPQQKLGSVLANFNSLETMKRQDGDNLDTTTYDEMKNGILDEAEALLKEQPELLNTPNPALLALRAALGRRAAQAATIDIEPDYTHYQEGALYNRLNPEAQNRVDALMLSLLDESQLETLGQDYTTPEEAAKQLGLDEKDILRAHGLLSALHEDLLPDDKVTFMTIDFSRNEPVGGEPVPEGAPGAPNLDKYLARVRRDQSGSLLSMVLDIVPPKEDNAAYILRNDDRSIQNVHEVTASKKTMRRHGARRAFHNEKTGEAGIIERIHKLLKMPFDTFRRSDDAA